MYVGRDAQGNVSVIAFQPIAGVAEEFIPDNSWEVEGFNAPPTNRLMFEILFDLENRVRTLAGQATITRAQYKGGIQSRWRAMNS